MKNPYALHLTQYSSHRLFIRFIGEGKTVLDAGCNDGYIGKHAHRTNTFYGLDYSAESVKKARGFYKEAIVYDLNRLIPLPWSVRFDVILFGDVLEHLVDPERTLSFFVGRYLKKHGLVIISVPNVANWQIRFQLLRGAFTYTDKGILDRTHLHLYTFASARRLAESAGLRILNDTGGTSYFGLIIRYLPGLKGLLANNIVMLCRK